MNHSKIVTLLLTALVGLLASCSSNPASPDASGSTEALQPSPPAPATGASALASVPRFSSHKMKPIVYVTSQGLFYDSIVGPDLPFKVRFQRLETGIGPSPNGLQTEFGPGDPGYLGGRWWVDENGDEEMDAGDTYFSCPLLGPGRAAP